MNSEQPPAKTFAPLPPIGTTIKFDGKRGTICAPDDPARSGTYTSAKYGEIPVKLEAGNRKQRRKQAAGRRT